MLLILLSGGLFTGIFISILLMMKDGSLPKENKFLSLIVFICTINIVHPHWHLITGHQVFWGSISLLEPAQFLIIPMVWIYIRNHLNGCFKLVKSDYLHFAPFIFVIAFLATPLAAQLESFSHYPLTSIFLWLLLTLMSTFYIVLLNKQLLLSKKLIQNEVSNYAAYDFRWNQQLYHLFFVISICYYAIFFILIHNEGLEIVKTLLSICFLATIWIIGIFALRRNAVVPEPTKTPNKSKLKKELESDILNVLDSCMSNDKLFLNPDLTLDSLAKITGYSRNELSWVLNQSIGKNFYKFVNDYRINQVIAHMNNPKMNKNNILSIALDSGFNTKQSFNSVFKEAMGKTPSQYRNSLKK